MREVATEPRRNSLKDFKDFYLNAKEVWQAGQMLLEASGEVENPIGNGTFQFTVGNIESGEEIGYKGLGSALCGLTDHSQLDMLGLR